MMAALPTEGENALSTEEQDLIERSTIKVKAGDGNLATDGRSFKQTLVLGKKNEREVMAAGNIDQIALA